MNTNYNDKNNILFNKQLCISNLEENLHKQFLQSKLTNTLILNDQIDVYSDSESFGVDENIFEEDEQGIEVEKEFKHLNTNNLDSIAQVNNSLNQNKNSMFNMNNLYSNEYQLLKCFICSQYRSQFFCDYCIMNGDFTSSKQNEIIKERFAEKKLKLFKLRKKIENINQSLFKLLNTNIEENRLNHEINILNDNKNIFKENLNVNNKEISNLIKEYKELDKKIPIYKNKNKLFNKKLTLLKNDIENRQHTILEKKQKLKLLNEKVRQATKERILELTQFIFPITTYTQEDNLDNNLIHSNETNSLLTFSGGSANSEKEDPEDHEKISIVEPWLQSNGDYSGYIDFALQHKDLVPRECENTFRTTTNRISSALSYSTQLLSVIGFYLDEKFPRKINFKEFYTNPDKNGRKCYLIEEQFRHKVAKLNANIFYFCLKQGVNIKLLCPKKTLKNLKLLSDLNPCTLDKTKSYIFTLEAQKLVEKYLSQDLAIKIEEDEFDYNLNGDVEHTEDELNELEWESVPEMPYASDALIYSNQTASTNIISSVVSIWRAATGSR